ncbi:MAG TPA: hypothetical protein VLL52_10900, partial [Anaerolineae bacterium]|nr:hypothetical protein [Anaerolineae bacterium]
MSWYYEYKRRSTIETDAGIKAKSKRGDFAQNWWAQKWIGAMEALMDRGRLGRGRRYARQGQVLEVTEKKGKVVAKVQGSRSRPYKVNIELTTFREAEWKLILVRLQNQPLFMAQLLAGEMPAEIEAALAGTRLTLFPSKAGELAQSCSCPDWAEVCKHLAAVHYILAERFDEDPFLIFRLRGKTEEEIFEVLRQGEEEGIDEEVEMPAYEPAPPLSASADFWRSQEVVAPQVVPPEQSYPVLTRLGEPSFMPDM